jgi:hypothetical protein
MIETEATSPEVETLARQMAAPIIEQHRRDKKFYARNRSATKRMNRPSKLEKMEAGADKIMSVLDRNIHKDA